MLQVRFVELAVVVVPALEARLEIAGAWFLITVIVSLAEPAELEQVIVTVLEPTARLTVAGVVTVLPEIVQVGVGVPAAVKLAEIELAVVVVVEPLAGLVKETVGATVATVRVTVIEAVAFGLMPLEQTTENVLSPTTSETLTPLLAALPLTVQVGAG